MSISREAAQELLDQLETARDVLDKVTDNFDTLVQDASCTLVLPAGFDRRTLLLMRELVDDVPWAELSRRPGSGREPYYVGELRRLLTYLADNA